MPRLQSRMQFLFSKCLIIICIFISQNAFSQTDHKLGVNLPNETYYSTETMTFVDRMKSAREWVSYEIGTYGWDTGYEIPLDDNGYPLQIPFDPDGSGPIPPQGVKTLVNVQGEDLPGGTYSLIFEGTGRIQLQYDATGIFTQPNVLHELNIIDPSKDGILLSIMESSVEDPIRNIRIIMPGFENNYETQIFHPLAISRLAGFKVIRFGWQRAWMNQQSEWSERTPPNYYTQALPSGVSYEYIVDFINRLDADPWINVPYLVDDEYIREMATLIRDRLDPGKKVYLEYANEVWNPTCPEYNWVQDNGISLGLSSNRFQAGLYFYARKSAEVFNIFEDVFGGTDQLVRVIASQAANSWTGEQVLYALENSTINPTDSRADALAIAPYYGHSIPDEIVENGELYSITVDEVLNRLETSLFKSMDEWTAANAVVARNYDVELVAYEGGQHLVGTGENLNNERLTRLLLDVSRDPRMRDIELMMLNRWVENGGGLFVNYVLVKKPSKYGSFGLLEYLDQPQNTAPRYQACIDFMSGRTGTSPSIPSPLNKPFNLRIK